MREFTGKPLSAEDWVDELKENVDDKVAREKKEYEESLLNTGTSSNENVDLNMTVKFVDGDVVIADSSKLEGGILHACKDFEAFIAARIAAAAAK